MFLAGTTIRRHTRITGLILATIFLFLHQGYAQGFLKAKGKIIVDGNGEKIILRGMGLGGWMLQEGYMFRLGSIGQQYRIREKIEELVGKEKTKLFYEQWLANHTTEKDIDSMAAWGFNSVRLPMHYGLYTLPVDEEPIKGQHTWIEKGFAMTDSLLNWCKRHGVYLILDLHATPGGQGNDLAISDRDPAKPSLWQSEANQEKVIALWRKLAERYAKETWIGGYDIINEPNWGFEDPKDVRGTSEQKNAPLRKLMMDITKTIREVDNNHIIIIEGNGFGNNYRGVMPVWDDNLVMSFHKYGNFNTKAAIQNFLQLSDQNNIPLWLGESGENSNTWFTEAIGLVESNDIGWAWWQEKKMGINNPLQIRMPEGYQQLLSYWSNKGPKPAEALAWDILQQLINNLRIENNIYHHDVTDAMFRQVQSNTTIPFKHHVIGATSKLPAVDFDLGRQRYAYYDKDTASYHYTPGVNTRGNRGSAYRNDGVDIEEGKDGYYVFSIEQGEWMQYTVELEKAGTYTISFNTSSENTAGELTFSREGQTLAGKLALPITHGKEKWELTTIKNIRLQKGINRFRIYADKGGFDLKDIRFERH